MSEGSISLQREIKVIRIPSGDSVSIPAGTEVIVTQALGDSFTVVIPTHPGLYRIAGEDADALGRAPVKQEAQAAGASLEETIWAALKNCYDPEIPVNIVDLGLIYSLDVQDSPAGAAVEVKMTLTAPGCGMGPAIAEDAKRNILTVPGVASADVALTWDPPWSPDRISGDGKAKLGMV